jgi:predicted nucleic acid-binding protein
MPGADPGFGLAVLDASVAVRWIVPELGATEALALLSQPIDWIAPRLMLTEITSALRRKVGAGELNEELATQGLNFILAATGRGALRLYRDETVIRSALTMALAHRHKVADCVYLALAEQVGAAIVTADRRLSSLAESRKLQTVLLPSA